MFKTMFERFFGARQQKLAVAHAELADALEKRDEALRQLLELPARLAVQQQAESEAHKRIMETKSRELAETREKIAQLRDEYEREVARIRNETEALQRQEAEYNSR